MKLSEKQQLFSQTMAEFILWINTLPGHSVVEGECFRPPEMQAIYVKQGKSETMNSKHCKCLAKDLNLFIKGKYCKDKEKYRVLGEKWELLGGKWGGRFGVQKKDYDTKVGWDSCHFEWA